MDTSNTETVILGQPLPDEQTKTETKEAVEQKLPENSETAKTETTQETVVDDKVEDKTDKKQPEKPKQAEEKVSKKEDSQDSKKEKDAEKPSLKLDFKDNATKEKPIKEQDNKEEARPVTENAVLAFLEEKGIKVEKLDDLSKKVTLNEQVEAFRKFNDETGLGAMEFYNLNRDWNKETKDTRITEYLKLTNPHLSDEDINTQLELASVTEEDEDNMDPRELKRAKLEFNKLDAEALSYLTKKSKEYAIPKAKESQPQPNPTKEDIAKAHQPYWNSRDKSLDELNEISFDIDGVGEIKLPIDEEAKSLVSKNTETLEAFINRWKEGETLNTNNLVEDTVWSIKELRQPMLQSIIEQAHVLIMDKFSKENRNVNLDGELRETQKTTKSGLVIQGGTETSKQDQKFGNPLI